MNQNASRRVDACEKEPIAIVGIGCRFPGGANSPGAFWRLLRDGGNAIAPVPANRWNADAFHNQDPLQPGKICSRWGGFVEPMDQFDAAFFGISPREASRMDPQQRWLLEVAWEALEDGGQVPEALAGSKIGVFVGISSSDYYDLQLRDRNSINAYTNLGGVYALAANRISYTLNATGPSLAIDTACSSALVAVHLACQSLWTGESTMALAGGVNAILRPELSIGFSQATMLSVDGRCHTFDARANGYVRGEGAGIVVLKPLSGALADRDPIYALIRGSAANQDGRTNGITVPNGDAQQAALREAYQQAKVLPEQVQYVEAHGTGTAVGDPIEANALGAVLGQNRIPGAACWVGSVKTNIGHLESASGIAGLIKVALCLKHGQIPPNLHFQTPNPKIPFSALRLRVPESLKPWPERGMRLAGVNSFGFGGTNAHVVLSGWDGEQTVERAAGAGKAGEATGAAATGEEQPSAFVLPLSARCPEALQAMAQSMLDFLADEGTADRFLSAIPNHQPKPCGQAAPITHNPQPTTINPQPTTINPQPTTINPLADLCYTAGLRRSHHDYRLTLVAESQVGLMEQLLAFLQGESRLGLASGRRLPDRLPQLVFVFSGMGPQWWGMGRQLLATEPVFREMMQRCDVVLAEHADWSLLAELQQEEARSRIHETQIAQCAIFSLQVSLAALWRSWGIIPKAIVGHSVGEVAAAHVAGVLNLEAAVRVIFHRSRLQATAAGQGKMLAVSLSAEAVLPYLTHCADKVAIAAINSPTAITLAGDAVALETIAATLEQQQVFCRLLRVEVPYHSPRMEPLKAKLAIALAGLDPQPATTPLFSTVTGGQVNGPELDPVYWGDNIRNPVLFAPTIEELLRQDYDLFLEISAHPVLAGYITECAAAVKQKTGQAQRTINPQPLAINQQPLTHNSQLSTPPLTLFSLHRKHLDRVTMLAALGQLYCLGYPVNWRRLSPQGKFVRLPSYPWQRQRYWHEPTLSSQSVTLATSLGAIATQPLLLEPFAHPLLGYRVKTAQPLWTVELDWQRLPYLRDHRIQGTALYPGAAYVEMALVAAQKILGSVSCCLRGVVFREALVLNDGDSPILQLSVERDGSDGFGSAGFEIHSAPDRLPLNGHQQNGRRQNKHQQNKHQQNEQTKHPLNGRRNPGQLTTSWLRHATIEAIQAIELVDNQVSDDNLIAPQNGQPPQAIPLSVNLQELRDRASTVLTGRDLYARFQAMGFEYGPCFQGIEQLWRGEAEALAQLRIPEAVTAQLQDYQLHPALLDSCFQVLLAMVPIQQTYLAVGLDRLQFYASPILPIANNGASANGTGTQALSSRASLSDPAASDPAAGSLWCYVQLTLQDGTQLKGDLCLCDRNGKVLAEIEGFCCRALGNAQGSIVARTERNDESVVDYCYAYQWQLQPRSDQTILRQSGAYLPAPQQIVCDLKPEAARLSQQLARSHYYETVEPQIDRLCTAYILKALQDLGWQPQLHQQISANSLAKSLNVLPLHHRLLRRLLAILQADEILMSVESPGELPSLGPLQWQVCQVPAISDAQALWRKLLGRFPAYQAELTLLERCGSQLAGVLTGEVDPLQLIFPQGSLATAEHLYQDSPTFRIYNQLVQRAIATALERLPKGQTVRILEIGAGTGALTTYVLPMLPAERTEYVFTDVTPLFVTAAQQKFDRYDFVQYQVLDIEADPLAQGFEAHSFDLILASDVLHATRDLQQTLRQVQKLLVASGMLVILELTYAPRWIDLVFGLLKGWWRFEDVALRSLHPLLDLQRWRALLTGVGFVEVAAIADRPNLNTMSNTMSQPLHGILLAQAPSLQLPPKAMQSAVSDSASPGNRNPDPGYWLIFTDDPGNDLADSDVSSIENADAGSLAVGPQLAALFRQRGEVPILISPGSTYQSNVNNNKDTPSYQICPERPEDWWRLLETVAVNSSNCRGVIHLWNLDVTPVQATTLETLETDRLPGCLSVVYLVQALSKVDWPAVPRLWLVTRGSHYIENNLNLDRLNLDRLNLDNLNLDNLNLDNLNLDNLNQDRLKAGVGDVDRSLAVGQSLVWGLGRAIANEQPQLRPCRIDLSPIVTSAEVQSLFAEIWQPGKNDRDEDDEIALRGRQRYANRLVQLSSTEIDTRLGSVLNPADRTRPDSVPEPTTPPSTFRLELSQAGILDHLVFRETTRRQPGAGEVEIAVQAAGLNFKDVAKALNLLSVENLTGNFGERSLGLECAGIVVAIGPGVEGIEIGQAAIAVAPHSFSTHVTTDARFVLPKPQQWHFEEAATIPLVFLTARYALHELGRIRSGDRVLIHAAAGGVGLAAVQIAQQAGAIVFATAGSPEKRQFLRSLGIEYVMNSRTLAFADEIRAATQGQGVDIVLNSLAGDAISKSLSLLADCGRFIEIGKRDIDQNRKLGLRPFQQNLSFSSVDIDRLLRDRPDFVANQFRHLLKAFADGTLHPLPHRVFPLNRIHNAFRYMAQAKHIGKIVISVESGTEIQTISYGDATRTESLLRRRCTEKISPPKTQYEQNSKLKTQNSKLISSTTLANKTYLITGGLGGFSLAVARWLVERGARHLVLMGRSGVTKPAAQEAVRALQALGAEVVVARADVSQAKAVAAVLNDIRQSMPPLGGIVHGALVLDDAGLLQQNQQRFQAVMAPKVLGAWNLHAQTLSDRLDFFLLFSSFTAIVGNPGQSNYAAASAFLDALAHHRRLQRLPALALNWGAIGGVGYVAQNPAVAVHLQQMGWLTLPVSKALEALEMALLSERAQVAIAPMNWPRWSQVHAAGQLPRFARLVAQAATSPSETELSEAQRSEAESKAYNGKPSEDASAILPTADRGHLLVKQVARVLGTAPDRLDIHQPLIQLGLDSLMAVELRNRLNQTLGTDLPILSFLGGASIAKLLAQLDTDGGRKHENGGTRTEAGEQEAEMNRQHANLSMQTSAVGSRTLADGAQKREGVELTAGAIGLAPAARSQLQPEPSDPLLSATINPQPLTHNLSPAGRLSPADRLRLSGMPQALRPQPTTLNPQPSTCLVPLQPKGDRRPFFCVHPIAGVVFPYYELACLLDPEQPFYGLQSVGVEAGERPLRQMADMARHYIAAMRSVQPQGPYLLGGWSFGAIAAFEMAQQLHRDGQTIAFLALFDTPANSHQQNQNFTALFNFFLGSAIRQIWPYVRDYFSLSNNSLSNNPDLQGNAIALPSNPIAKSTQLLQSLRRMGLRLPAARRILNLIWLNTFAVVRYRPQSYSGPITLFRSQEPFSTLAQDPSLGWANFVTGDIQHHSIPGQHLTFLRSPHIQSVAQQLQTCLNQVQQTLK